MTLPSVLGLPSIRSSDIARFNKIIRPDKRSEFSSRRQPLRQLKGHHRKWMDRILVRDLSASQYTVLSAIVSRTFGFQKIIETIPLSVFAQGMRDPTDASRFHVDKDGLPYFAGTGLSITTIRKALDELADGAFIERYALLGIGRETHAYLPVSFWVFWNVIKEEHGLDEIPECFHAGMTGTQTSFETAFLNSWRRPEGASVTPYGEEDVDQPDGA